MSEKLAWAAGFFDGEGNTCRNGTNYEYIKLDIHQASNDKIPEVLLKFHKAVNNLGSINGPYKRKSNHSLMYRWRASSEQAKEVLRLLWPYLGEVKREQATKAGFLYFPNLTIVSDAS